MKPNFKLPTTALVTVVWYRNGIKHEELITTPKNNEALFDEMRTQHKVGYSDIRAVKAVNPLNLLDVNFRSRHR